MVFAVEDTTAQLTWLGSLLPADAGRQTKVGARGILHLLRHATMR